MGRRSALTAVLIALPILAFVGVYLAFFTPDAPPPVTLNDPPQATAGSVGDPTGFWTVASGSEAGYRVREKLVRLPAPSDAVGKTSAVTGQLFVDRQEGRLVAREVFVEVDMTQLRSDETRRDRALRERGLETDRYPVASFTAAGPIPIPEEALGGSTVRLELPGELTLHGVTRPVTIPVEARFSGGRAHVVGSMMIAMSDFDITPPNVANIVTVEPEGTLEFNLMLTKS
ncbi:MAG: YceI family protein [Actinomycetota bacterium]|nr:YceI family protein [Actinomycetota bacterium]